MGASWTAEGLEKVFAFALRVKAATYDADGDLLIDSAFLQKEVEYIENIGVADMIGKSLLNDVKKYLDFVDGHKHRIYGDKINIKELNCNGEVPVRRL